jgi:hypothetical protein
MVSRASSITYVRVLYECKEAKRMIAVAREGGLRSRVKIKKRILSPWERE